MGEHTQTNERIPVKQEAAGALNFFDPVQFETMQRVCKMFANSELVPDMYKASDKNPLDKAIANCMIAIEISQRIGASPLMVMQNMVPIYGKPSWSSKFLIATVNSCGRFEPLKYRFTEKGMLGMVDYTEYAWDGKVKKPVTRQFDGKAIMDIECVAYTTAKGSDAVLESAPVSIRMAVKEGWFTKNGSKWVTMGRQMLMYRAASMWTNTFAPELSMGMRTVEENQDIVDVDYSVVDDPKAEIEAKANRKAIGFDATEPGGKTVEEVVDTETGEVKRVAVEAPAPAPAEEAKPGF
ncbi:MAG: hypothetical protein NC324_02690 [Bacteroides sp.]|nr:hypothetical protein [Bacteroides sp.]